MIDAQVYRTVEKLKDGTEVVIRAIRADDRERLRTAFENLESESIYRRFFTHKSMLSEEELKAATEVDFETTVALVVTVPAKGGDTIIIGAARYVLYDPTGLPRRAEIAFTVEEDFQRRGISSRLLRHLVHIAREKGVSQFEADVLPENRAMLAVFARSGLSIEQNFDGETIHVTLSLPPLII